MFRGIVVCQWFLVVCIATATTMGCERKPNLNWERQEFDLHGMTVSVEMPAKASASEEGNVRRFDAIAEGIQYTVKGTAFPDKLMEMFEEVDLSVRYESLARSVKGIEGKIVRQGQATVAGRPGYELVVDLQDGKLGINVRFIIDSNVIYSFDVSGPRDRIKSELFTKRYFDSIVLK